MRVWAIRLVRGKYSSAPGSGDSSRTAASVEVSSNLEHFKNIAWRMIRYCVDSVAAGQPTAIE